MVTLHRSTSECKQDQSAKTVGSLLASKYARSTFLAWLQFLILCRSNDCNARVNSKIVLKALMFVILTSC